MQMEKKIRESLLLVSQCDFPTCAYPLQDACAKTHPCLLNHVVGVFVVLLIVSFGFWPGGACFRGGLRPVLIFDL